MTYKIQTMISDDYSDAIALWRSLPGLGLSSADEEEAISHFLELNPNSCFIARDGDKIIGTVLGGSDGRRGYLYHLAVHKNYQRVGLGRQLSEKCLAVLRSQGLKKCHIFVISDNLEGLRFWDRLGWQLRKDILVLSKNL